MDIPLITVSNVSKHFSQCNNYIERILGKAVKVTALDDISFCVNKAEIFAFTGPDGAGKTTILNILSTLWLPDSGTITILGKDCRTQAQNIRQDIGYLPERFSLYEELTTEQNIQFYSALYGVNAKDNHYLISNIYQKLEPFKDRKAKFLSGGMKQKLALCCALIHHPKILILDEPTKGIDPVSRNEMWDMLLDLKRFDITLIVATSYYHELQHCNRIAFIDNGKIMCTKTSQEVFQDNLSSWHALQPPVIQPTTHNTIIIKNLTKRFGHFTAVDDISLSVKQGEVFGFLGANGAGKTTVIQMLCGLIKPTEGYYQIAGCDIHNYSNKQKKKIGYMSQTFHLFPDLEVCENIRLFAGLYGMKSKAISEHIDAILAKLNMTGQKHTLVNDLPLGDRQKLSFVTAIIHNPEVVFLDEPTSGASEEARHNIWEMIHQSATRGITVFVTTHYMEEAMKCNRVCMMINGKIKAIGSPAELMHQYHRNTLDDVFHILSQPTIEPSSV